MPTPLYPIYERRFGFGGIMVTLIFAVYAAGVIGSLILFGRLSDEIGRRAVLLPGLAFALISSGVFLVPGHITTLFIARVLSGLSAGIFTGTATATLADLAPPARQQCYSLLAAAVNMFGLGLGPVFAGVLAQFAPAPLFLPYAIHIGLVLVAGVLIYVIAEPSTITDGPVSWRPQRVSVPSQVRGTFIRAVIVGFAGFAVIGLFNGVSPSFVGQVLHISDHLILGLVVFTLLAASTLGEIVSSLTQQRTALLAGCVGLVIGVLVVGLAVVVASLWLLLIGAVVAGIGQGMSFRAGLGSVTAQSPSEQRSEVESSFFVVLYVGMSLPIVGEGLAAAAVGLVTAAAAFAVAVAILAAVALASLLTAQRR